MEFLNAEGKDSVRPTCTKEPVESSWESIPLNASTIGSKHDIVSEAFLIKQFKYAFNSCSVWGREKASGQEVLLNVLPWEVQGVRGA